jgi:hypothetical protein
MHYDEPPADDIDTFLDSMRSSCNAGMTGAGMAGMWGNMSPSAIAVLPVNPELSQFPDVG